jgi:hypothetical protein
MTTTIELAFPINEKTVEHAHRQIMRWKADGLTTYYTQAMRAVRARDPKLLAALERCTETMDRVVERQMGQTRRDHLVPVGERAYPMEAGQFKTAYEALQKGDVVDALGWTYAMAGLLAGVVV